VVYQKGGLKITAFPVEHADGNPAFGYRVDWNGRSVLLSGDTTLNENVIKHGAGVDLIVHNVIAFGDRLSQLPEMKGVLAKLTTPKQAARCSSARNRNLPSIRTS
jgi:ribonuclease Z